MEPDPSNPRLGLRDRKKREAQRAIRAAALRLFIEHGYGTVSIEQIAEAADVSRTTFFNYFPSKEAVVLEPDPSQAEVWQQLRTERPLGEPLWQSLTAILLGSIECSRDWVKVQKLLKAAEPASNPMMHDAGDRLFRELYAWVEARIPPEGRAAGHLQLNIALSAVMTAFEQWDIEQPFETLVGTVSAYLDQLGRAFAAD